MNENETNEFDPETGRFKHLRCKYCGFKFQGTTREIMVVDCEHSCHEKMVHKGEKIVTWRM